MLPENTNGLLPATVHTSEKPCSRIDFRCSELATISFRIVVGETPTPMTTFPRMTSSPQLSPPPAQSATNRPALVSTLNPFSQFGAWYQGANGAIMTQSTDAPPSPRSGQTPKGYVFSVPQTTDMFKTLLSPKKWGPAEALTVACILIQCCTIPLIPYLPQAYFIIAFAFWRCCYNVGIAKLLHDQSKSNNITLWVQSCSPSARALLNWATTKSMSSDYSWENYPPAFNAWLAFRALCMVILSNDGFSYSVLVLACFNPFHTTSLVQNLICVPLGLALLFLSFWTKAAAHDVVGDFAWYWGDFFFTVDAKLVFDGVFELFPHPMYTVGYAAYYGMALFCRSYTLLAVSLLAHIAQLLFLAFVEEPHIQKIYGSPSAKTAACVNASNPKESKSTPSTPYGQFVDAAPRPPVFFSLAIVLGSVSALCISAKPSAAFVVFLLLFWRTAHWVGMALFLRGGSEEKDNLWIRWYLARGYSRTQAYSSWQHVFLSSYMLNHALFFIATLTLAPVYFSTISQTISHVLAGTALIAVAAISLASTWSSIGYFGFFYGDFFAQPRNPELASSGMFRYVSNPEAVLGYLVYYGVAFIKRSQSLFILTAICQCMHLVFVKSIEARNIAKFYNSVRKHTPLESAAMRLPLVSAIGKLLHQATSHLVKYVDSMTTTHGQNLIKGMVVRKELIGANVSKSLAKAREKHVEPRKRELRSKAESVVGEISCENLVTILGKKGIVVQPVSQSFLES